MELIKESIKDHALKKGDYLFPETSYASAFKVNRTTVRRAINILEKEKVISPVIGKKRRILKDINIKSKHRIIGCLAYGTGSSEGSFGNLGYMQIFEHLVYRLQNDNMSALKILINPKNPEIPEIIHTAEIEAFISFGGIPAHIIKKLSPLVLIDPNCEIQNMACSIFPDGKGVALDAIDYLITKGHKKIGVVRWSGYNYMFYTDLVTGFLNGLNARTGCTEPEKYIITIPESFQDDKSITAFFQKRLSIVSELDALVLHTSDIGSLVMNALRNIGINVPKDISVLGIGGNYNAGIHTPPLTAFENDYKDYVDRIWRVLKDALENKVDAKIKYYSTCFKLVERDSVLNK